MVIYLYHERHGQKVAISEAEAKADEKHGWKRQIPEPVNELVAKKRGRPAKDAR